MVLHVTATKSSAEPLYLHSGSHTNHNNVNGSKKGITNRNAAFFVCFRGELGAGKRWMDAIVFYF